MRLSKLFGVTLRAAPAEAEIPSHQLLLRAGYIRQLGAGMFSYLPLAHRAMQKISDIIRSEIDAIGGQEITMPVVHPGELWKETGRYYQVDASLTRLQDRAGRDLVLGMTHEEVVADLVRKNIQSYRQLPALVYQIQTKWRDEARPRAGLIRTREFTMKDSYSLDRDEEGLDRHYRQHYQAYFNIFRRCGLDVIAVRSDVGMMGGRMAHEFMYLTPHGEDTLFTCAACGYAANREVARFRKPELPAEPPLPLERVATPDTKTIASLAALLNIPPAKTAKAVFYVATITEGDHDVERFVFAVVRGDMELNDTKLQNALKAKALRPAREDEIIAVGAVPGYASPIGIRDGALIAVDEAVVSSPNLVAGANEAGYHLLNTNYDRDFSAQIVADLAAAQPGDACPNCGSPLETVRGVEVGNIFKLGTRYTAALGANFLDQDGTEKPVIMGSYGIGVGRLLACVAECSHDENGLILPITIAPYPVHLVGLPGAESEAEALYADLRKANIDTLFDDRDERAGTKFKDADLIGMPIRLTISPRTLENGGVELKLRAGGEARVIPRDAVIDTVRAEIVSLTEAILARLGDVPFTE
ncbi:proline--tRNA ligase [Kamptonema cortianum]|nr:proline--tRNA ligase [Oscillatoria laete-virens]MDK3158896.1 proline--tRNA ligase [Kamptonema cortianum]MDL5052868.1 proline--tRNA ligase [Oscillatoria laete-virens NRMC-F 0139]